MQICLKFLFSSIFTNLAILKTSLQLRQTVRNQEIEIKTDTYTTKELPKKRCQLQRQGLLKNGQIWAKYQKDS